MTPRFKVGETVYTLLGVGDNLVKGVVTGIQDPYTVPTNTTINKPAYTIVIEEKGYRTRSVWLREGGLMSLEEATAYRLKG